MGAKSRLTKGIKEANAGGAAAQKIARLGIQAVVVEGKAKEPTLVRIDENGTRLPALHHRSPASTTMRSIERMKAEYGNKIGVISIGSAGEKKLTAASIAVTSPDFHIAGCRKGRARGGDGIEKPEGDRRRRRRVRLRWK